MARHEIEKALDAVVKKLTYMREGGKCYMDGLADTPCQGPATDTSHLFGRDSRWTRWDTHDDGNVHLMCRHHHQQHHEARLVPSYADSFVLRNSEDDLIWLRQRAYSGAPIMNHQLEEMLANLLEEEADN